MITDHPYKGEIRSGASCQYVYIPFGDNDAKICARQAMEHAEVSYTERHRQGSGSNAGLYGEPTSPEAKILVEAERRLPVLAADAAQYVREAIPEDQRGQIRVRLLNATPDPLGSVAALIAQYSGRVIRSLGEVTDEERRAALDDMGKTVLNGPLEAVQFHWQIEGVTRSITHQMVRSRASFFAQESLRFAVPEGNWAEEIPLPPSLSGALEQRREYIDHINRHDGVLADPTNKIRMLDYWEDAMLSAQNLYQNLIELGMPAEEARGVLPHDMPTRIHWICDLRTLLAEAGKRTCTQAQFPWRMIFAGMAQALREYGMRREAHDERVLMAQADQHWMYRDAWQYNLIAARLRPVCFQTGRCGFMAQFDRSCKIRERVDKFAEAGIPSHEWGWDHPFLEGEPGIKIHAIHDYEWAADPSAARS